MKSSVINIGKKDWDAMRFHQSNIRWMREQPNAEDFLICTKKENDLLQNLMKKLWKTS